MSKRATKAMKPWKGWCIVMRDDGLPLEVMTYRPNVNTTLCRLQRVVVRAVPPGGKHGR